MIERRAKTENDKGRVPPWMVTFADLMALMMTFFVLLYSFSKVDEAKYRSIVNSMTIGFDGSQWIKRKMGENSPSGPEPGVFSPPRPAPNIPTSPTNNTQSSQHSRLDLLYQKLSKQLAQEITQNNINLLLKNKQLVIRFPEKISFDSGSEKLLTSFRPVVKRIGLILRKTNDQITISGHTDNVPINTERFRSNWDLSSARAVSVAHLLIMGGHIYKNRIIIQGYADTHPLKPNTTPENRATNRRVEISITPNPTPRTDHDGQ